MPDLSYLMEEICCGVEVYVSSRTGGQYRKTAFILCDDYTELTTKLHLKNAVAGWTDTNAGVHFKSYHAVMADVKAAVAGHPAKADIEAIVERMKVRRTRRNDFFHGTHFLDLSVNARGCVDAYLDLIDLGRHLFGAAEWNAAMAPVRNLAAMELLLRLDLASFADETIQPRINKLLEQWPRNRSTARGRGVQLSEYPEDLHLRLTFTWGGDELKAALSALLYPPPLPPAAAPAGP